MSEGTKETEEPRIIWRKKKPKETSDTRWVRVKDPWKRYRTGWKAVPKSPPESLEEKNRLLEEPPYFPSIEDSLPKGDRD